MAEKPRILIVEDDRDINEMLADSLSKAGYSCEQAYSGSEARLVLDLSLGRGERPFDLVLTDLMLPGASGEEIVQELRRQSDAPVIVISARCEASDKVALFHLGADDFLTKPFDLDELQARIDVQLRHLARSTAGAARRLCYKEWILDCDSRTLLAAGAPVRLTRLEFGIVEALVRRPKKVFTKQELFAAAWNEECFGEEKVVNVHISNIRSKLRTTGTSAYLETIWGIGFKLAD